MLSSVFSRALHGKESGFHHVGHEEHEGSRHSYAPGAVHGRATKDDVTKLDKGEADVATGARRMVAQASRLWAQGGYKRDACATSDCPLLPESGMSTLKAIARRGHYWERVRKGGCGRCFDFAQHGRAVGTSAIRRPCAKEVTDGTSPALAFAAVECRKKAREDTKRNDARGVPSEVRHVGHEEQEGRCHKLDAGAMGAKTNGSTSVSLVG